MNTSKKMIFLMFILTSCLALILFLFVSEASSEEKEDSLSYTFVEPTDDEFVEKGPDYIEYEFEGLRDYEFSVKVKVTNEGNNSVNFTLYGFEEEDLVPNPNKEGDKKIDIRFTPRENYELDAGRSITITVAIDLSDELLSNDEPYTLTLRFRNDDARIKHYMYVNMTILPVYELEFIDSDRTTKKTGVAGGRVDLILILTNYGNREDTVEITTSVDGEGLVAEIRKPKGGRVENLKSVLEDEFASASVSVSVIFDQNIQDGKYTVNVKATSFGDENVFVVVSYTFDVTKGTSPPKETDTNPTEEGSIPTWLWIIMGGVIAGGGGGSVVLYMFFRKKEEEEWEGAPYPPAPAFEEMAQQPPFPAPAPAPPALVRCPKCNTKFRVKNPKRPLKVKCPGCSALITLKAKVGAPTPVPAPAPAPPALVRCPKCNTKFRVKNPKRPLKVKCPGCSALITLKAKVGAPVSRAKPAGAAHITCPGCRTKFKVTNPKRPLKVKCPGCARLLTLK